VAWVVVGLAWGGGRAGMGRLAWGGGRAGMGRLAGLP